MSKKIFFSVILLGLLSGCLRKMAQSSAADPSDQLAMLKKNFSDDITDQLKTTKTVFFYKKDNATKNDSIEAAVSSSWDITPIIFDDVENFQQYATNPRYSYFNIEGITTTVTSSTGGSYTNTHYYLILRLINEAKEKRKANTIGLCRIELYPNTNTLKIGMFGHNAETIISKLYDQGVFYNWTPILLKAQLASVQTNLKSKIRPWLFENIRDENLTQILSNDTLYVPKNLLVSFNAFSGKERNDKEDVFLSYKYKFKVCDENELYRIFETEKRGRLVFEYVKSSTDKFVTIYDVKDKKILYKKYTPLSYNLKSKDLKKIK